MLQSILRGFEVDIEPFGEALLKTGDLDPIYVMLHRAELELRLLHRWLVAYSCFYHAGVASKLAEAGGWGPYTEALASAPRGTERRHFRGAAAVKAVDFLKARYTEPEGFYDYIAASPVDLPTVISRVEEHYLCGPWIAFKWCDLLDRCSGVPLVFDEAHVFMFDSPAKAVDALWERREGISAAGSLVTAVERRREIVDYLLGYFAGYLAPPAYDRPLGLSEVETILCKFLSPTHGHYPLGKDIREIRHGIKGWGPLAERLGRCLPEEVA